MAKMFIAAAINTAVRQLFPGSRKMCGTTCSPGVMVARVPVDAYQYVLVGMYSSKRFAKVRAELYFGILLFINMCSSFGDMFSTWDTRVRHHARIVVTASEPL